MKVLKAKISQKILVVEHDQAARDAYEATIKGSIERAVLERDTVNSVVSEIGNKTGDWGRDLGRIAATEMENAYQAGRAADIESKGGKDAEVWKEVYPQACRFCIQFYTTGGIGSKPVVFKLNELRANGTNVGRKQKDWKPVLYTVHPWCRCMLKEKKPGYVWDEEKGMFVPPKRDPSKPKKGIVVTVGDKKYNI